MAKEERVIAEEVSSEIELAAEKPKKGIKIVLFIVGIVAILQCGVLFVIFQDEISTFFENMKPEPVEVEIEYPLEEISVNLADKDSRHFLRTTISLKYVDESLTETLEERKSEMRATVIEYLRSKKYEEINSVEGTRQMESELLEILNKTFETEGFKKVLFTNYVAQ